MSPKFYLNHKSSFLCIIRHNGYMDFIKLHIITILHLNLIILLMMNIKQFLLSDLDGAISLRFIRTRKRERRLKMSKLQLVHTYFKSIFICRDNFVHVLFYFKQKDNLLMSIKQLIHIGPFSLYHKWVLSDVNPIILYLFYCCSNIGTEMIRFFHIFTNMAIYLAERLQLVLKVYIDRHLHSFSIFMPFTSLEHKGNDEWN